MSFSTVTRDIEARLLANWSSTAVDINVNTDFSVPGYDVAYIKLRVFNERTNRVNVGQPAHHRTRGTIVVQIFTPKNTGTRTGSTYADDIVDIFHEAGFNGITCEDAHVQDFGEFEGRWQTNVVIPFYWDAIHT